MCPAQMAHPVLTEMLVNAVQGIWGGSDWRKPFFFPSLPTDPQDYNIKVTFRHIIIVFQLQPRKLRGGFLVTAEFGTEPRTRPNLRNATFLLSLTQLGGRLLDRLLQLLPRPPGHGPAQGASQLILGSYSRYLLDHVLPREARGPEYHQLERPLSSHGNK